MPYRELEHSADLMLEVTGMDFKDLLYQAFLALNDKLFGDLSNIQPNSSVKFEITGQNKEELLHDMLDEILYRETVLHQIFTRIKIEIQKTKLIIEANYRISNLQPLIEIKGVTYHDLNIEKTAKQMKTRILFDV